MKRLKIKIKRVSSANTPLLLSAPTRPSPSYSFSPTLPDNPSEKDENQTDTITDTDAEEHVVMGDDG